MQHREDPASRDLENSPAGARRATVRHSVEIAIIASRHCAQWHRTVGRAHNWIERKLVEQGELTARRDPKDRSGSPAARQRNGRRATLGSCPVKIPIEALDKFTNRVTTVELRESVKDGHTSICPD